MDNLTTKAAQKVDDGIAKLDEMHAFSRKACTILMAFLPRPFEEIAFRPVTIDHLSKCKRDELIGFIHVRTYTTVKILTHLKFKWPKKGTPQRANDDEKNLLSLALKCCCLPVILPFNEPPAPQLGIPPPLADVFDVCHQLPSSRDRIIRDRMSHDY